MREPIRLSDYDGLIREVLASGGEFRIYPHGTSMLPLLRQGVDSVVLRAVDSPLREGDILFYQRADGSYVLHRLHSINPQGLVLWGDNQTRLERGVSETQVIGRVCRIYRDEHEVSCDDRRYRCYVRLWQFAILRRILLRLYYHFRKENTQHGKV